MSSDTPKPKKVAIAWTFSLLRDGAASAVVIQIRGDCTPKEISQRKMSAIDTLPCASDGVLVATTKLETMSRQIPQNEAVEIRIGRRPTVSGRKWPVKMAT